MNTAVTPKNAPAHRGAPINLCSHHAQCELNYHLSISLMPGLREDRSQRVFSVGEPAIKVCMQRIETAPYTTTIEITQVSTHAPRARLRVTQAAPNNKSEKSKESNRSNGNKESLAHLENLAAPQLRVRLYHDVEMAEVIAWDNHRHWLPVYTYPNRRMYLPDEKLAINRFLGEWLSHCLKLGIACDGVCESIRNNGN